MLFVTAHLREQCMERTAAAGPEYRGIRYAYSVTFGRCGNGDRPGCLVERAMRSHF